MTRIDVLCITIPVTRRSGHRTQAQFDRLEQREGVKTRFTFFLAVASLAILFSPLAWSAKPQETWTLRIVPTQSSPERGISLDNASKGSVFYVVLTNISQSDLAVWREWCSWGYDNLSFDIRLSDGRTFHVKKKPQDYKKDWPDSYLVKKGTHFVISVRFDELWEGFPEDWRSQEVRIKAIYKIERDQDSQRLKVWTGQMESTELTATLFLDPKEGTKVP